MKKKIKIKVPASTANLGPGFDTLSLALDWCNEFTFKEIDLGLKITYKGETGLPEDSSNLVYQSFCEPFKKLKKNLPGVEIVINSNIPLSGGLGSSSTAVVAGLLAGNHFLDNALSDEEIIALAAKLEGHPDNCAAALMGGLTVSIMANEKVIATKFEWPNELKIVIAVPDFKLPTNISRELLPSKISFSDAVFNISRIAYMLSSLAQKNYDNLALGFQDKLHQPYRKDLVHGMDEVLQAAVSNGACGASLSGAGPTLVAFVNGTANTECVAKAMATKWKEFNVNCKTHVASVNLTGATTEILNY